MFANVQCIMWKRRFFSREGNLKLGNDEGCTSLWIYQKNVNYISIKLLKKSNIWHCDHLISLYKIEILKTFGEASLYFYFEQYFLVRMIMRNLLFILGGLVAFWWTNGWDQRFPLSPPTSESSEFYHWF